MLSIFPYHTAKRIYLQLRSDLEIISLRTYEYDLIRTVTALLAIIDTNIECVEKMLQKKLDFATRYSYSGRILGMKEVKLDEL